MADPPPAPTRLSGQHKLILALLLGTQFMLTVDFSILNVALPDLGADLAFSKANLQWVATAFALPAAGFTLLFGRFGDLFGRRRLFLGGMGLLAAASLLGGLTDSQQLIIVARVLQGLATAMATPAALSLLTTAFPEGALRDKALGLNGALRDKALGLNGALLSGGFTVGALLGGVLTDVLTWRWAFLLNVPIALLVLFVAPAVIKESRTPDKVKLDIPGAITVTAGLLALTYGFTAAGTEGWSDPVALGSLAAAVLLLTAFYLIERKAVAPLASVRILNRPSVKWGNVGGFLAFGMETAVVFMMTLYLQEVLHYSAMATGLAFAVPGVAAVLAGLGAPKLIGRFGSRNVLVGGLLVQAVANLPLLLLDVEKGWFGLVLAVLGIGFYGNVTAIVAFNVTATSGLPNEEQGLATGLTTLTQQIGFTLGIPLLSSMVALGASGHQDSGSAAALLDGIHLGVGVDVAVTAAGLALIATFLRSARQPSA
ncbi:EmrB/QacA subfamily drug resistance transporter [Kitasatospora gansuensis]|uniref:EmrB/QacA subfamily drug resistance transporter n=1 Tax=Kitasatospora gansuensis TaxID=258050 RepID=A0A7W7WIX1_9ACTN|nr:MFS transporter [Kitasatospora gansuensis]MBB4948014.1 EmrB/QacA subfamily drug resistance transporter [Kitasatospora gansuensis]